MGVPVEKGRVTYNSACAAAGQLGLMSLYETMFSQYDVAVSQLLVTSFDFTSPERRRNIQHVISQLLALGVVPLINENDAVSANQGYHTFGKSFSDNDSLAALVSVELSAHLLVLLTDVEGVYDRPPNEEGAKVIDLFRTTTDFVVGEKSLRGRGGMGAKVEAAVSAVKGGVQAVVIASGREYGVIDRLLAGQQVGTLFLQDDSIADDSGAVQAVSQTADGDADLQKQTDATDGSQEAVEEIAKGAKRGSLALQRLCSEDRRDILLAIAANLLSHEKEILAANQLDLEAAEAR